MSDERNAADIDGTGQNDGVDHDLLDNDELDDTELEEEPDGTIQPDADKA